MKNILIPTDFSENARCATQFALSYFADNTVTFHLLHVDFFPESSSGYDGYSSTATPLKSQTSQFLKEEIQRCQQLTTNPFHKFNPLVGEHSLIENIRRQVEEKNIDYIVMGTKGANKSNIKEIGSNAYEVITKVKCPTIVIPEETQYKNTTNLALPTDFNNWDKDEMMTILYETILIQKLNLHILQIKNKDQALTRIQQENKDSLVEFLNKEDYTFHYLENKNIDQEIQEYVDEIGIDMIALVGRNLNFVQRLLFLPKSDNIDFHLKTPFLILHE